MAADNESETVVRRAFEALGRGDIPAMLELVDPDLEWTFLDPSRVNPKPQVCHGRKELGRRASRRPVEAAPWQLEEIVAYGDRVLVVTHAPGIDDRRARKTGDRNFHVVTVRDGRITALRACGSREEAAVIASISASHRR
jgi:uncharacterized protein